MKGNRVVLTLLAVFAILCVLMPAPAQAQPPNPCTQADFGLPGEASTFNTVAAADSVYLKTRLRAGRSYVALAWAPTGGGPAGEDDADVSLDFFTDNTCTTAAATVAVLPATSEPSVIVPGHAGAQVSIIPTTSGTFYIRAHNNAPTVVLLKVMVFETTISSPWWFAGGSNQAFAEIRNNSGDAVAATVTVFRPNGTVCGTTNLNIPGDGNTAVSLGTLGTCAAAVSGSAQIAFQGMPGGVTANVTTIDAVNGTSFDSPFSPRMVWALLNR
jgi:hypothetical protein